MSDMTDERMIEVLRKEGREYRQEIKGLKDMEYFRTSIIKKLKTENKALEESNEMLLDAVDQSEIKERKTFKIIFKEVGTDAFKACASDVYLIEGNPNWQKCPQIEQCSVSKFLTALKFETGEEKTLKVTIREP